MTEQKQKRSSFYNFTIYRSKKETLRQILSSLFFSQYLVHEFPAFLHHFLIDHCRLVGLRWLLVRLKGVLHQADETGAPPRISGH